MSDKKMWFGTRGFERWVPMFESGPNFSRTNWSSESTYLNGGGAVRNSSASHHVYDVTWSPTTRDNIRPITDFADGVYDSADGVNLLYFIDPLAADKNVAPQGWGFPAQQDAMPLFRGLRPVLIPTPQNPLSYPARTARYTLAGTETADSFYVPVPPDFTAWVGLHGTGVATVTPYTGLVAGAPTDLAPLSVSDTTRVNAAFTSADCSGIEIAPKVTAGTFTFTGLIVQILPTGATPEPGGYISGQGHSGCQFVGKPGTTPYTVAAGLELVGLSAKLKEVGSWL